MGCAESCGESNVEISVNDIVPTEADHLRRAFSTVTPRCVRSRRDVRGGSLYEPMVEPMHAASSMHKSDTAMSLDAGIVERRMSRMRTLGVDEMTGDIERTLKSGSAADCSLEDRLSSFGMQTHRMESDGNCQFRSLAFNLFGSQKHHAATRKSIVAHMKKHRNFFAMFFDGAGEFEAFVNEMEQSGTWGDELTLRAAVEAYGCIIHVITSESANWYLVYAPEREEVCLDRDVVHCPEGIPLPPAGKHVFLSYVSPVHYNSIIARSS